jgi:bacillithiol synthase
MFAARCVVIFERKVRVRSVCIPFSEIPQTSRLFADYLSDFDRLRAFFPQPPTAEGIASSARAVKLAPDARSALVRILRRQNERLSPNGKLDAALSRNLDRLAAGAVVTVSGQQVGLFSGPALTIYKAITTIRWAEDMSRRGADAVPIFWLATQDHDLAEVNESFCCTRNGLARYDVPAETRNEGKSVGRVTLGSGIEAVVEALVQTLDGPAASDVARALRESYTPAETFGSAFGKLLSRIFAGRGLLLIDPQDGDIDRLASPVYRAAIERADELRDALLARSHALEEAGYHQQVKVTRESTLLFCDVEGRREPLHGTKESGFVAGGTTFAKTELLALLERSPGLFSASALLRPVVQDTILPTAAVVGGPAEIAYLAQSQVVYEKILGRMPALLPRASFTLVEPPIAKFLEQYDLEIRDLLEGRQHVRAKMEQKALPDALSKKFEDDEEVLRRIVAAYRDPLERLDPTLIGSVESTQEKILGHFLKMKEKVGRAENFRTGVLDRHETILLDALYMNHELQERHLSALPHLAAHGTQLLDEVSRRALAADSSGSSACAGQHHVLFLD